MLKSKDSYRTLKKYINTLDNVSNQCTDSNTKGCYDKWAGDNWDHFVILEIINSDGKYE